MTSVIPWPADHPARRYGIDFRQSSRYVAFWLKSGVTGKYPRALGRLRLVCYRYSPISPSQLPDGARLPANVDLEGVAIYGLKQYSFFRLNLI